MARVMRRLTDAQWEGEFLLYCRGYRTVEEEADLGPILDMYWKAFAPLSKKREDRIFSWLPLPAAWLTLGEPSTHVLSFFHVACLLIVLIRTIMKPVLASLRFPRQIETQMNPFPDVTLQEKLDEEAFGISDCDYWTTRLVGADGFGTLPPINSSAPRSHTPSAPRRMPRRSILLRDASVIPEVVAALRRKSRLLRSTNGSPVRFCSPFIVVVL